MKKSMIIGFDFDKIFIDTPPFIPNILVDFLYKGGSYFKRGNKKGHLHYRYPNSLEQKIRIFSHIPIFRPPLHDNIAALRKLRKENKAKIYLISSRFGFLKKRTQIIIEKYRLDQYFDGTYFNYENKQPHLFKEETIKKLGIEKYVEDDLDLALYLSSKIPELKIYWLGEWKNKKVELPANITAIKNLGELEKYL